MTLHDDNSQLFNKDEPCAGHCAKHLPTFSRLILSFCGLALPSPFPGVKKLARSHIAHQGWGQELKLGWATSACGLDHTGC